MILRFVFDGLSFVRSCVVVFLVCVLLFAFFVSFSFFGVGVGHVKLFVGLKHMCECGDDALVGYGCEKTFLCHR